MQPVLTLFTFLMKMPFEIDHNHYARSQEALFRTRFQERWNSSILAISSFAFLIQVRTSCLFLSKKPPYIKTAWTKLTVVGSAQWVGKVEACAAGELRNVSFDELCVFNSKLPPQSTFMSNFDSVSRNVTYCLTRKGFLRNNFTDSIWRILCHIMFWNISQQKMKYLKKLIGRERHNLFVYQFFLLCSPYYQYVL